MAEPLHDDDLPAPTRSRRSTALALLNADPPPPPDGAVLHPPTGPDPSARKWFLAQLLDEARLAFQMYFDSRYRVSRVFQFTLPAVLALFALNYFFFAVWFSFPIVSPLLERVGCVVLGVFLYRLLVRELARYRDVLDYLARYAR
ncbi:hypothetical protein [Urbifossiella limnaea]|uniref:Uncharacterized protein n=1 Tax=Urbifossiella limnaea TaxID=2528023 RepID=A0A517XU76_9BACT|nr:hypothetical protein [Urbifossiella limnaea]QDU21060.1 hypothetical protein ETAA1_30240 [Urbifossiella limnaea]